MTRVLLAAAFLAGMLGCSSGDKTPEPAGDSATAISANETPAPGGETPPATNRIPVPAEDVAAAEDAFDTPPKPLANVAPVYPEAARNAGISGQTLVLIDVDATGHVTEATVTRSSGNDDLDAAAVAAAMKWTFTPAEKDGKPVPARIILPIQFALN